MTQKETLEWSFLYRKHVQNFYAENYKTLMKELREDRWRDVMSLQTGRFKAANMASLSKFTYTHHRTPAKIHQDLKNKRRQDYSKIYMNRERYWSNF